MTTLDGYQMARQGRAGPALAAAGLGSFIAGCVGTLLLAAFAAPLTELAFAFGPAEYCALMVVGLIGVHFTGWLWLDAVVAIGVALNILREGWHLVYSSSQALMDEAVSSRDMQLRRDAWMLFQQCKTTWRDGTCQAWQQALNPAPITRSGPPF